MTFESWLESTLFKSMGVQSSSTLMVHSSLRELSTAGVKAEAVCDFLTNYLSHGNVIMPTMTWRTVNQFNNTFDVSSTPSHTGILTEIFRTQYAAHRSLHPTHSVAATGVNAAYLTQSHHLSSGPCSSNSPYGLIEHSDLRESSFILLIGVGLESCTYIHVFEEIYNEDAFLKLDNNTYYLSDTSGVKSEYALKRHTKRTRDFHQFGRKLAKIGGLVLSQYEGCDITLINVNKLSEILHSEFKKSLLATYCCHSYLTEIK
ncbi:AAC(3) family N-acetyltransferase [Pseudoalteromonas umbrosa]|uniref:AAC(3) family N-acetyltransferase n=1 Tax=Pseudoalteromonas umbrosa TaxID=3048489 RepID=UPI0024C2BB11|nr:AAC(3) family N-acetyltransferase [Pseudoalteromonas sp. B95]MDK1285614.1 AAC(3) family N-acetyltransferase [Pseudoalteromonas sp. B95]